MIGLEHPDITRMNDYGELYEDKPIHWCVVCGYPIYKDDTYYDINGDIVCDDSICEYLSRFRKVGA